MPEHQVTAAPDRRPPETGPVERLPLDPRSPWWGEHRSRYRFAGRFATGMRVLEIACGSGFGAAMLLEAGAASVVGVDLDPGAVAGARRQFPDPRLTFTAASGTGLPFADGAFGAVTSFETVEHVPAYEAFVRELRRVTAPGGTLVLSTPNRRITSQYPANPFHVQEFTAGELRSLLTRHYRRVKLTGQLLAPHYRVAPFLPGRERARAPLDHVRLVVWKLMNRLPFPVKDALSRACAGRPFYPAEEDYLFDADPEAAPVLVAVCQP